MRGEICSVLFFVREIEKWDSHKGKTKKRQKSEERDELKKLERAVVCLCYLFGEETRAWDILYFLNKKIPQPHTCFSSHDFLVFFFFFVSIWGNHNILCLQKSSRDIKYSGFTNNISPMSSLDICGLSRQSNHLVLIVLQITILLTI